MLYTIKEHWYLGTDLYMEEMTVIIAPFVQSLSGTLSVEERQEGRLIWTRFAIWGWGYIA